MTFDEYQAKAMTTALDVEKDIKTLYYRTLGLTNEAGEVAGKIKKIIRDSDGKLTVETRQMLADELGDVLWYLQALADYIEVPLDQIAQSNIDKLFSRKDRGKLKGSGDNR